MNMPAGPWGSRFFCLAPSRAGSSAGRSTAALIGALAFSTRPSISSPMATPTWSVGRCALASSSLALYAGLLGLTYVGMTTSPTGFIPEQDQGYLVVNVMMPPAASVQRPRETMDKETRGNRPEYARSQSRPYPIASYSAVFTCDSSTGAPSSSFLTTSRSAIKRPRPRPRPSLTSSIGRKYHAEVFELPGEGRLRARPRSPGWGGVAASSSKSRIRPVLACRRFRE